MLYLKEINNICLASFSSAFKGKAMLNMEPNCFVETPSFLFSFCGSLIAFASYLQLLARPGYVGLLTLDIYQTHALKSALHFYKGIHLCGLY